MIVRPYQPTDLQTVLYLINTAAHADRTNHIAEGAFQNTWLIGSDDGVTPQFDESAVVTTRGDTVIGFAWWDATSFSALQLEGWVHAQWRRKGVGTALLTAVESYVRQRGHGQIKLSARSYADVPGVAELFRLKNYQVARNFYIMATKLPGRNLKVEPPSGVTLRSFRADDLDTLVEADNNIFAEHWGSHSRSVVRWKHDMIERRPHDPQLWTLAWAGDRIVAECLCHTSRENGANEAWIATVGVQRDWRGRGLGRMILMRGLQKLQEAEYTMARLSVDAENTAAINLYRSVGMDIVRARLHFNKTITV